MRKRMTMNCAIHPKGDVDRLYFPRVKGGCGLISCESCIGSKENSLGWYLKMMMMNFIHVSIYLADTNWGHKLKINTMINNR